MKEDLKKENEKLKGKAQKESSSEKYWLSLEQWGKDPEFQKLAENEFLSSPLAETEETQGGTLARREFLKLMGASLALSTTGCLRRPVETIVPYTKRPQEVIPGNSLEYSSSFVDGTEEFGLIVKTREGRPIKVEGNPHHPSNKGGLSARAQAHILNLYDPDRIKGPKQNLFNDSKTNRDTINSSYKKIDKEVIGQLKKGKAALLTPSITSPSTKHLISQFKNTFQLEHFVWDVLDSSSVREAQKICYGDNVFPRYVIDKAQLIVSVGADFLGTHLEPVSFTKAHSKNRNLNKPMNRVVMFEGGMSLTGINSDERKQVSPSEYLNVIMGILYELIVEQKKSSYARDGLVLEALRPYKNTSEKLRLGSKFLSDLAEELWQNRGKSLILASQGQGEGEISLQIATNFLNSVLQNDGRTVNYKQKTFQGALGNRENIDRFLNKLQKAQIKTLIIHGLNPSYAFGSSGFNEFIKKTEMVVYTGDRIDETALNAHYIIPHSHSMEFWSDNESYQGVYTIQQPTIRPLYNTRSFQESLLAWIKKEKKVSHSSWYDYVRWYWRRKIYSKTALTQGFEKFWYDVLQNGFVDLSKPFATQTSRRFLTSSLRRIKNNFKKPF